MGYQLDFTNQSCINHNEILDPCFLPVGRCLRTVPGLCWPPYAAHAIVGLKSAPCVNAANVPVPCAAGYYGKRDAEADPQLLVAGVPFGSSTGLDPITQGLDAVTQGVALPYHAGVYGYGYYGYRPYGYRAYGYGYPYRYGYYGKRDADAEP